MGATQGLSVLQLNREEGDGGYYYIVIGTGERRNRDSMRRTQRTRSGNCLAADNVVCGCEDQERFYML